MAANAMFSVSQHNQTPCPQHLLDYGFGLVFNVPCASVTHICRHGGNDVVHKGMNISLILHLGCGTGWHLVSMQVEKVIVLHENTNKNGTLEVSIYGGETVEG